MFGATSASQATGLTSPTYEDQGSLAQSQPSVSTPHTPATPLTPSLMTPSIDKPAVSMHVVDTIWYTSLQQSLLHSLKFIMVDVALLSTIVEHFLIASIY